MHPDIECLMNARHVADEMEMRGVVCARFDGPGDDLPLSDGCGPFPAHWNVISNSTPE
jgi:hypothetical protein